MFDLFPALTGAAIHTITGTPMTLIAHVPAAAPHQRLVVLDPDGEVNTYWDDGKYMADRSASGLDLTTPRARRNGP